MKKVNRTNNPDLPLVEGLDYYLEDGKFVFTQHFHLKKGYCCKNGCRHCPYGFNLGKE